MKLKYRLLVPTMMTIFNVCAILAKLEMKSTGGIVSLLVSTAFVWLPTLVKRIFKVNIPALFEYCALIQIFCAIGLGSGLAFYYRVGFWDILAHTFSGVLFSFGALWLLNILKQKLNDWMMITFAFLFSTSVGVLWEMYEFFADRIRDASDMQRAKFETTGVGGVMDTMIDIVCNFVGCLIFIGIFIYDKKKKESALMISFENECNRVENKVFEEDEVEVYGEEL